MSAKIEIRPAVEEGVEAGSGRVVAWKQREREGGGGVSMSSRSKRVLQVSPSLPAHFLSLCLFLPFLFSPSPPPLSLFPFSVCLSRSLYHVPRAPFRVLPNPSRSPHLIRLLAFSRMKELQRLSWDTRKYYLARLPTKTSLLVLFPSDERRSRAEPSGEEAETREREKDTEGKRERERAGRRRVA